MIIEIDKNYDTEDYQNYFMFYDFDRNNHTYFYRPRTIMCLDLINNLYKHFVAPTILKELFELELK